MGNLATRARERREELGLTQGEVAKACGVTQSAYQLVESGETLRPRYLTELADVFKTTVAWLKHGTGAHSTDLQNNSSSLPQIPKEFIPISAPLQRRKVPVYGPASAASPELISITDEFIVDKISCPEELADVRDGFVMFIAGDSMYPRYKHGEMVSVHPRRPPYVGQDCVVVLEQDGNALVKEFAGETESRLEWKFKQYMPEKILKIKKAEVRAIYAVVGRPS